jgi:hypothetical protein
VIGGAWSGRGRASPPTRGVRASTCVMDLVSARSLVYWLVRAVLSQPPWTLSARLQFDARKVACCGVNPQGWRVTREGTIVTKPNAHVTHPTMWWWIHGHSLRGPHLDMAASEAPDDRGTVEAVAVVFRHGARSLSANARHSLAKALTPGHSSHTLEGWTRLDELTKAGEEQMEAFGEWFAAGFLQKQASELAEQLRADDATAYWGASPSDRVIRSSELFWRGLFKGMGGHAGHGPRLPEAANPDLDPDTRAKMYQPWLLPSYPATARELATREDISAKAREHEHHIERIFHRCVAPIATSGRTPTKADSSSSSSSSSSKEEASTKADEEVMSTAMLAAMSLERKLYQMRHIAECIECEMYCSRESFAELHRRAYSYDPVAMSSRLGLRDVHLVREFTHWGWQRRFDHPSSRSFGLPLLRDIIQRLAAVRDGGKCRLIAHGAHDYTMLMLLAALRVKDFPKPGLSYGSHVIFVLRRHGSDQWGVEVLLNAHPFPFAIGICAYPGVTRPTTLSDAHLHRIIPSVPLESLEYMVQPKEE